jgi:predicted N-formylglutamate amidohydrolase
MSGSGATCFALYRRHDVMRKAAERLAFAHSDWWQMQRQAEMTSEVGSEAFRVIGEPRFGGVLIVADHASNRVPDDIDLGIDPALLTEHVAIDIGVAAVAARMARTPGIAAFLGNVSRLVCDFNREEDAPAVIPHASDGHPIPGNLFDLAGREARLARFHRPYHEALAALLDAAPPALILSLHSFTPSLRSEPQDARPWQGRRALQPGRPRRALGDPLLEAEGLVVGDQQPYSGTRAQRDDEPPRRGRRATLPRHRGAAGPDRRCGGAGCVGRSGSARNRQRGGAGGWRAAKQFLTQ